MSGGRRPIYYGAAAALVGGGLWCGALAIGLPSEEKWSVALWLVGAGGFVFWGAIGAVVGAVGNERPGRLSSETVNPNRGSMLSRLWIASGRLLGRLVIGSLMGGLVTIVCLLLACAIALYANTDQLRGTFLGLIVISALLGTSGAGLLGGIVAAVFATKQPAGRRAPLGRWALLGAILGAMLGGTVGLGTGAVCAAVYGLDHVRSLGESYVAVPTLNGLLGGVMGGALSAVVSSVRLRD
jgi:hypothetical protein